MLSSRTGAQQRQGIIGIYNVGETFRFSKIQDGKEEGMLDKPQIIHTGQKFKQYRFRPVQGWIVLFY